MSNVSSSLSSSSSSVSSDSSSVTTSTNTSHVSVQSKSKSTTSRSTIKSTKSSHDDEKSRHKPLKDRFEGFKKTKLYRILRLVISPFYAFLRGEPEEYKVWKMMFGFPVGCLFGYGLYCMVVEPMDLGLETRELLGTLLVFGLASGFSMAAGCRCVCILMIPTFMGKAGRSYIGAFAIAYLIAGPIENMVNNGQDITRSLTCAAELAANHTAAKWKLRTDPLSNVLKQMQEEGFLLNKVGQKVNRAFSPIKSEVRDEKTNAHPVHGNTVAMTAKPRSKPEPDAVRGAKITQKYKRKVEKQCDDIYNMAIKKCRGAFSSLKDRCFSKLPDVIDDIFCPIVDVGFVCDIIKAIGAAVGASCDSDVAVMDNFGKVYTESENTIDGLDQGFDVNVQYKVIKSKEAVDYTSVEEMRSQTVHEFKQGRKWVEFVMVIIKRLLGFTFLLVVIGAYKYYTKYSKDIRFDNIYITSYFRKIDARRKQQEKRVLLPLKKVEADACIYTSSPKLMKSERAKLGKGTMLLMARIILAVMVFFVDNMLYSVLMIIRQHSRVDYKQTGVNHIEIKVGGTGVMSNIVRMFLNGLSGRTTLDKVSSNRVCLPRPSQTDVKYFRYVFGIFLLIWILILLDAYALRLRRIIAAFFFRKREKKRILHLYNTMMGKRKFFLLDMRRRVKRKAKKLKLSDQSGLLYALRRQFPGLCGWLKVCQRSKPRCLICNDVEKEGFMPCQTPGCSFTYCKECWCDVKGSCYACLPVEEFSSTDDSDLGSDTE